MSVSVLRQMFEQMAEKKDPGAIDVWETTWPSWNTLPAFETYGLSPYFSASLGLMSQDIGDTELDRPLTVTERLDRTTA